MRSAREVEAAAGAGVVRAEAHEQLVGERADVRADEADRRAAVVPDERRVGVSALSHFEHVFAAVRRSLDVDVVHSQQHLRASNTECRALRLYSTVFVPM